jgi:hypothetical protein
MSDRLSDRRPARRIAVLTLSALLCAGLLAADVSVIERRTTATGDLSLIDSAGLEYFINTDVTFTTSSSASAAASDATYTAAVNATTSAGGIVSTTLNDAFDGYNALCVSLSNTLAQCNSDNFVVYNRNGAPPTPECNGRQYAFPIQTAGGINISRKVYVPANDQFARWLNIFTNTTGAPVTFAMVTSNNLGSDTDTRLVSSSNGNATAEITDSWVSSFQNYSGGASSDPRLGHVFQGAGAPVPLAAINFVDGDDNPWWGYSLTLAPGETRIIANFVTGQPSKAAANAKAAQLATLPPGAALCLSETERQAIANFVGQQSVVEVPTLGELGLAVLAVALTAAGLLALRRRSAAARVP